MSEIVGDKELLRTRNTFWFIGLLLIAGYIAITTKSWGAIIFGTSAVAFLTASIWLTIKAYK